MTISKTCVKLNTKGRRSVFNFLVNLMAGLATDTYLPKKALIDIYPKDLPVQPPAVF